MPIIQALFDFLIAVFRTRLSLHIEVLAPERPVKVHCTKVAALDQPFAVYHVAHIRDMAARINNPLQPLLVGIHGEITTP